MPVDSKHPLYDEYAAEWCLMRDACRGESAVKSAGKKYLPMPSGFKAQPDQGAALYQAYQTRAQFPDIAAPTVGGMVGVIHGVETSIEMPDAMQGIWEKATKDGLSLEDFHRRITAELLTTGRYGVLVDAAQSGSELPYLVGYSAERIINWSQDQDFYVLDETGLVRSGFEWELEPQYLVLELEDGRYRAVRYKGKTLAESDAVDVTARGNRALDAIPFVIMGARDLSVDPEVPPLIGVGRSAVSQYQLSADYRWQLFMTGQETLFVIDADAPDLVGAGVTVSLMGNGDKQPDAKYVGPAGTGIGAHRDAIQDEKQAAIEAGARLFSDDSRAQESGEAIRLRYTAQTASLISIAQASAAGLERALRYVATMIGANPDEVVVDPPKTLVEAELDSERIKALVESWQSGAISYQTLYENLQDGKVASPERDWEEERKQIDEDDIRTSDIDSPEGAGLLPRDNQTA